MKKNFKELINILKKNYLTVSVSESITGGQLSAKFTKNPGASSYFISGLVIYSNFAKKQILNVSELKIKEYGVVSKEIALEMIEKHFNLIDSNIYISITGNAGPDVLDNKPIGKVYIGIKIITNKDNFIHVFDYQTKAKTRQSIIDEIIDYIVNQLLTILKTLKK